MKSGTTLIRFVREYYSSSSSQAKKAAFLNSWRTLHWGWRLPRNHVSFTCLQVCGTFRVLGLDADAKETDANYKPQMNPYLLVSAI